MVGPAALPSKLQRVQWAEQGGQSRGDRAGPRAGVPRGSTAGGGGLVAEPTGPPPLRKRQAHHPQACQTPDGWGGKRTRPSCRELGHLEPPPSSTRHSVRGQQGAEGCRLSAPELALRQAGCRASHPPGCLALTQHPQPRNKQSPTVTADTHHSPLGLPSDQQGLG